MYHISLIPIKIRINALHFILIFRSKWYQGIKLKNVDKALSFLENLPDEWFNDRDYIEDEQTFLDLYIVPTVHSFGAHGNVDSGNEENFSLENRSRNQLLSSAKLEVGTRKRKVVYAEAELADPSSKIDNDNVPGPAPKKKARKHTKLDGRKGTSIIAILRANFEHWCVHF